jgi:hypothetical protein
MGPYLRERWLNQRSISAFRSYSWFCHVHIWWNRSIARAIQWHFRVFLWFMRLVSSYNNWQLSVKEDLSSVSTLPWFDHVCDWRLWWTKEKRYLSDTNLLSEAWKQNRFYKANWEWSKPYLIYFRATKAHVWRPIFQNITTSKLGKSKSSSRK